MNEFTEILAEATAAVAGDYFMLPVAGLEDPIYRERVYCYELYHQIRLRWPNNCPYSLGGEVDKRNHPLIRGNGLDNKKPDFLVHVPGDMGGNYAAVEVKPITASGALMLEDVDTLGAFNRHASYERAVLLLYGDSRAVEQRLAGIEVALQERVLDVEVWHHMRVGERAMRVL